MPRLALKAMLADVARVYRRLSLCIRIYRHVRVCVVFLVKVEEVTN